jgi:hypothetical protein
MARRKRRRTKIYYSDPGIEPPLYWECAVSDAKSPVTITGSLEDALKGQPGSTVACTLAICTDRHRSAFPHDFYFCAFTRTRCYIVDKIKNGRGVHAWMYRHKLGRLIESPLADRGAT